MNIFRTLALATSIASVTLVAAPAMAQVSGSIATADPVRAIAASSARQTAYQQISQTYAAQLQSITAQRQQATTLRQQLDTNGDGQVSDQEGAAAQAASNPVIGQLQTLQTQINTAEQPIVLAQLYALEQITQQYDAAQRQVVTSRKIGVILTPEAFVYAPDAANVTGMISDQLNKQVPSVTTAVPAGWQPSRQTVALHQQIQEILVYAALAQQQQQQQQQPAQQPSGR